MWPFRKAAVPVTEVTASTYTQWLRAHRPPWKAFFELPHAAREHLAEIGDAYTMEIALAFGHALANPALAQAGAEAARGDVVAEEMLSKQIADDLLAKIAARRQPTPRPSMSGALRDKPQAPFPRTT
jgi:hypothetical protein